MDIIKRFQKLLLFLHVATLLVGVTTCLAKPAIRLREPEFEPAPGEVTYKTGERAKLLCSVKHLGDRTVTWRKVPDKNPLTIGTSSWIVDPRISVQHSNYNNQWDLIIDGVTARDMGLYECQISFRKKLLRHAVQLYVIESVSSGQVKRNPGIAISGTQVVSKGGNINLFCNISKFTNPRRALVWYKDTHEMTPEVDNITLVLTDSQERDLVVSNLRVLNAQSDDSGLYTCRTRDKRLMTSAHVTVVTGAGGSNNVKRDGLSTVTHESGTLARFHVVISHFSLLLLTIVIHLFIT